MKWHSQSRRGQTNDAITILLPHDKVKHPGPTSPQLSTMNPQPVFHLTTIGNIQRVTGLNFLPKLTAAKREAIENYQAPSLWPKE